MRLRVSWKQPGSSPEGFRRWGREYLGPSQTKSGAGAGEGDACAPWTSFEVLRSASTSCAFVQGREDKL